MKKHLLFICMFVLLAGEITYGQPAKFWGVTNTGGIEDEGTIFSMNIDGTNFTTHHSFISATGSVPFANLVKANNNKFYGTTHYEGANFFGVIYSFDPATNTYTDILDFDGINGGMANCGLLLATDGNLYGVTEVGGSAGNGVLFRVNPADDSYTILKHFDNSPLEGSFPSGSLMQAANGLIYGTANAGGRNNHGTIFSYNIVTNTYTKLVDCTTADVHNPLDGLMQASNGLIYGMSSNNGAGCVFSFDIATNTLTSIKDFSTGGPTGSTIGTGTLAESNGKLYGMVNADMVTPSIKGHLFSIDITNGNAYANVFDFSPVLSAYPNGSTPYGHVVKASDGNLYGNTYDGGSNNLGVSFRFDPATSTFTKLHDFAGGTSEGSRPIADLLEVLPPPCTAPPAKPDPITVSGGSGGVCTGDTRIYNVAPVANVVYSWTAPTGANITSGQGTATINVTFTAGFIASDNLSVTAGNSCGTSGKRSLKITKNPAPDKPGPISGAASVCNGSNHTYSISPVAGATSYLWTVPPGASITGPQNGTSINVHFGPAGGAITVRSSNGCGTSAVRSRNVSVNCREVEATYENVSHVEVFPNPAHDKMTVKFEGSSDETFTVKVTDMTGRVMLSREHNAQEGLNKFEINVRGFAKGLYIVSVQNGDCIKQLKVLVE
ncbi:MAG TPA: choice-of-anchor tandem repeat GloVer-containing protein [Bacteroidia bacterium]|nr:choice-of-anchor tandem repeat GloVer-containing protein [Bacteroidia bacterium]